MTAHVLIVDDELGIGRSAKRGLERRGWNADVFQGIGDVPDNGWDALVLDLGLRGSSGMTTLDLALERWPHLPVVIITGDGDADAAHYIAAGAAGFVRKPFTPDDLVAAVTQAMAESPDRRIRKKARTARRQLPPGGIHGPPGLLSRLAPAGGLLGALVAVTALGLREGCLVLPHQVETKDRAAAIYATKPEVQAVGEALKAHVSDSAREHRRIVRRLDILVGPRRAEEADRAEVAEDDEAPAAPP